MGTRAHLVRQTCKPGAPASHPTPPTATRPRMHAMGALIPVLLSNIQLVDKRADAQTSTAAMRGDTDTLSRSRKSSRIQHNAQPFRFEALFSQPPFSQHSTSRSLGIISLPLIFLCSRIRLGTLSHGGFSSQAHVSVAVSSLTAPGNWSPSQPCSQSSGCRSGWGAR
mgnify:CR=1 FL=1